MSVRVLHRPDCAQRFAMLWRLCSANQRAVDDGHLQHCAGNAASDFDNARSSCSGTADGDPDSPVDIRWVTGNWGDDHTDGTACRRAICTKPANFAFDFPRWHIRLAGAPTRDCGTSRGRGGHGSRAPRRVRSRCQTVPSPSTPPAATQVAGESSSCSQL